MECKDMNSVKSVFFFLRLNKLLFQDILVTKMYKIWIWVIKLQK